MTDKAGEILRALQQSGSHHGMLIKALGEDVESVYIEGWTRSDQSKRAPFYYRDALDELLRAGLVVWVEGEKEPTFRITGPESSLGAFHDISGGSRLFSSNNPVRGLATCCLGFSEPH